MASDGNSLDYLEGCIDAQGEVLCGLARIATVDIWEPGQRIVAIQSLLEQARHISNHRDHPFAYQRGYSEMMDKLTEYILPTVQDTLDKQ